MTIERSVNDSVSVSTRWPSRTASSLGASEYSTATPSSDSAELKSSDSRVVAFAADDDSDTHRYSLLLVHCAATVWSCSPNRHRRSSNGCRSAPATRTSVSPAVAPLAELRLVTVSGVWYANCTSLRLNCCPFIVTSTLCGPAPPGCTGDVHVTSVDDTSDARTACAPNLHR